MRTGAIIYRGPSAINGDDIVVIAIPTSKNEATGNMVQTYIIRSDMNPTTANRTGKDSAICGDCKFKGTPHDGDSGTAKNRSCYVLLHQGPRAVYAKYFEGGYPDISDQPDKIRAMGAGRKVRLGTYGDPAAVSIGVWSTLLADSIGRTGYSHNSHNVSDVAREWLRRHVMYSADSVEEALQAEANGWRTYTVTDTPIAGHVLCPKSAEAGKKTTCDQCLLCNGADGNGRSVWIHPHGAGKKHFNLTLVA